MQFRTTYKKPINPDDRFSILIPSWNNLPYLKLCIDSIKKNSTYSHQILVFVNEGIDGTTNWLQEQKDIDYILSEHNQGVCYALNALASIATTDYILYMNDDMYACPKWDFYLMEEINGVGHTRFFISGTTIERNVQSPCSIAGNYGENIANFQESKLLKEYQTLPMNDWNGATWPPNIVHRSIWDLVGGYSIEFSPGMYSDPDFSIKLWEAGIRYFKGVALSRVYHFGSLSVKRVKHNNGYYTFISKWGMTSSTFSDYILQRGRPFNGSLETRKIPIFLKIKNTWKQLLAIFKRQSI